MHDAIVIGSGIGGLTAAGLLANVAGQRVLVLEKHTEPGGLTHVFRRDGAAWDVGVHYVGEIGPGTQARAIFDYLSGGALRWNRMTDELERFVYPGLTFAVPSAPQRYQQRLVEQFPDEAGAIQRYFRDLRAATRWTRLGFMRGMVPGPVEPVLRLIQRYTGAKATQTTKAYLERNFRSPLLRALLASQWGDYGLPPGRSAFAIHAQIVTHYLDGAWFPDGGASRIARTFEKGIERAGGTVRVAQEVVEILVEQGRAVGVKVIDHRGATPCERIHRAPVVISNAGAPITFRRLLSTQGDVGARTAPVRQLIDRLGVGLSTVTLYLRLKASAATLGVKGENYWINASLDHDDTDGHGHELLDGRPRHLYASFPSIKAGDERFHTAELISFIDSAAFDAWGSQPKGNRGADYSVLKERISDGLLRLAETAIPGLRGLVEYAELSTPLSVEYYTSHPGGRFYGLPATPERYRSPLLWPRTPIEGLYLSGSDAGCLGIVGAMMGGVGAACQALGSRGYPMIQAALKKGPIPAAEPKLPPEKKRATLAARTRMTPTIWQLDFELGADPGDYAAGQFGRVHVGQDEWRDYSIADLEGRRVRFLISTRTGGHGSRFAETVEPGTITAIELPLGHYTLVRNDHRKVFVATGTGLAPYLPMFRELERTGGLGEATLIFGCATNAEDLTRNLAPLPGQVVRCISREDPQARGVRGRVTKVLDALEFAPETTDFYLCGSSAMVADARMLLERRGAKHLLTESY